MCAYLNKPVSQHELLYALLTPVIKGSSAIRGISLVQDTGATVAQLNVHSKPKQHLLLAEDNVRPHVTAWVMVLSLNNKYLDVEQCSW